jgi:hypothetical protein
MSKFSCSICKYSSPFKHNINTHINKQTKCGEGVAKIIQELFSIKCDYCDKEFTTTSHSKRHLKTCKVKKENLEKELAISNEEVKKLKEELLVAKALIANKPSVNITNNNNINNNNINIHLTPWNDPRLPDDVEEYYRAAVKKVFLAVPSLIKMIHFNEDHPENHNICIKNARNKTAKVYNGKEWESIDEDDLIRTLITDYERTLEDFSDEKNLKYNSKIQEIKDRDSEEKLYDDLHNLVKRTIYDRNYMINIKTKNKKVNN